MSQEENARQRLLAEQQELRAMLERFAQKDGHVVDDFHARFPDYGSDEEENAEEVSTYQDELSIEATLEKALRSVDAALERIEQGTYGKCHVCGTAIDPQRLEAAPTASRCKDHLSA